MTNFKILQMLIYAKNEKSIVHILKKYRIPINKSKYC